MYSRYLQRDLCYGIQCLAIHMSDFYRR